MTKVSLHGAEFFALHGFYPEERLTGCRFVIDIDVEFEPADSLHKGDELSATVNYEELYTIAAHEMKQTKKLLEAVAGSILKQIRHKFPFVKRIVVTLKKLNPPLGGQIAYTAITLTDDVDHN